MAANSNDRNKRLASDLRASGGKHILFKASPEAVDNIQALLGKVESLKTQQDVIDYCIHFTRSIIVDRGTP